MIIYTMGISLGGYQQTLFFMGEAETNDMKDWLELIGFDTGLPQQTNIMSRARWRNLIRYTNETIDNIDKAWREESMKKCRDAFAGV